MRRSASQAGPDPAARSDRRPEIDGLRALAVLCVMCGHFVAVATNGSPQGARVVGIGNHGVDLFFVLSGFCLSYPILLAKRARGREIPHTLAFLRRRFSRIAPPYYAALSLFALLSFTRFGLPTWPYAQPSLHVQLHQVALDAAFLPSAFPLHNSDFWSLGVEMRWYVLFPMLLALYERSRWFFAAVTVLCYGVYLSPDAPLELGMLPCFMLGIVAADVRLRNVSPPLLAPVTLVALAVAIAREPASIITDHGNPLWHVALALLVISVTGIPVLVRAFAYRPLVAIGVASFSLYLIHHPVLMAISHAGGNAWLAAFGALVCGFAFWRFVERPMQSPQRRRAIERCFGVPARLIRAARLQRSGPALPPVSET